MNEMVMPREIWARKEEPHSGIMCRYPWRPYEIVEGVNYIRADIARRLRRALVRARQDGYVDPDLLAETKWLEVE